MRRDVPFKWRFWGLRPVGRLAASVLALSLAAACTGEPEVQYGDVGYVEGFFGGVAADEPQAALVGRDMLTSGGSAADAAVAIGFTLAVTYPSAVSLGGGGACIVHDSTLGLTETLDFVPPAGSGVAGDRPSAIPALTRGLAALHARYGRFPWRAVVSPAERLARIGQRVSRAFATDLVRAADPLYGEPTARAVFAPDGRLVGEGDRLVQPDLAGVLGQVRARGAGALYNGPLARRMVEGVQSAGGTLTLEELQGYTPAWRTSIIVPYDDSELHFTPPPAAAGPMLALAWRMLSEDDRYADATPEQRVHLLAEVMKIVSADRKDWLATGFGANRPLEEVTDPARAEALFSRFDPARPRPGAELDPEERQLFEVIAGTGFVVTDSNGMAVACNLTNYNPFGTGRIAGDTGILLAAAPGLRGRNPLSVGPVIAISANTLRFRFAAASGGGPLGPASTLRVMSETLLARRPLEEAIEQPRLLAVDTPDTVLFEEGRGDDLAAEMTSRGHPVTRFDWRATTNAIHCPQGTGRSNREARACQIRTDPRGFGLGAFSEEGS